MKNVNTVTIVTIAILWFAMGMLIGSLLGGYVTRQEHVTQCTPQGSYYVCQDVIPACNYGSPYLASDSVGTPIK